MTTTRARIILRDNPVPFYKVGDGVALGTWIRASVTYRRWLVRYYRFLRTGGQG